MFWLDYADDFMPSSKFWRIIFQDRLASLLYDYVYGFNNDYLLIYVSEWNFVLFQT